MRTGIEGRCLLNDNNQNSKNKSAVQRINAQKQNTWNTAKERTEVRNHISNSHNNSNQQSTVRKSRNAKEANNHHTYKSQRTNNQRVDHLSVKEITENMN